METGTSAAGGGGSYEASFDVDAYRQVLHALQGPPFLTQRQQQQQQQPPLDIREIPVRTLEVAKDMFLEFASSGEIERRYATMPRALSQHLLDFQKDGVSNWYIGHEHLRRLVIMYC